MTLLPLFTCNAVPFNFPEDDKSIHARRCRARRLRRQMERRDVQQQVDRHLQLTTMVVEEAVDTFERIISSSPSSDEETVNEKVEELRPPPNSPNNAVSFEFPEVRVVNVSDGLLGATSVRPKAKKAAAAESTTSTSSSEDAKETPKKLQRRRSLRKRRRVPSFKNKTEPRVPNKLEAVEADDEASDVDDVDLRYITEKTDQIKAHDSSEDELRLKLKVLSEVRKTDWAKVGVELRNIADKFAENNQHEVEIVEEASSSSASLNSSFDLDNTFDELDNNNNNNGESYNIDLVDMVNMMLPFSVPQSLWSALVSYAAWKIFKRFQ